ncbi:Lipase (class 2) [Colwellia chukchiensis]|uniref:Lipase (Class 2) n=1 Tax=Colwellia chukchiensis TaxID=641665 RepID=A0A1H7SK49_9GAMM|nr:alpha/beta fold hydrolase [Colwellia chukchiensis]SEL72828.1 Lipase (class 2) [Colwellia chukchiensis]
MKMITITLQKILLALLLIFCVEQVKAACVDSVVLVHGNTGTPEDWANTYDLLIANNYQTSQIFMPQWGGSSASYNNHSGAEETPVRNAINDAIASSCTGKIDIIGHSMGVTLAAQQVIKLDKASHLDAFVGIAGAYRGLWTCGAYPWHVYTPTCGVYGLSVSSPFLDWLYGKKIAARVYSIKSWSDQIVCGSGTCRVGGIHASQIANENASYSFALGHFGLQTYTASKQLDLIK